MDMTHLAKLAKQQLDAEAAVELAESSLAEKKEALRVIKEDVIPEVMEQLELDVVTTRGGLTVNVMETLRASISQANLPKALAWLRKHGHEKLIKGALVVTPADAKESAALQKKLGKYAVENKESVHTQSLKKFVKEMLEDGKNIPEKLFGVHKQRVSKITVKK